MLDFAHTQDLRRHFRMLKTAEQRIPALLLGVFALVAGGVFTTTSVAWKPWGVKDHEREKYESIVSNLRHQDLLREKYEHQPRPILNVESSKPDHTFFDLGVFQADQEIEKMIQITNQGEEPLVLKADKTEICGLRFELSHTTILPGDTGTATVIGRGENVQIAPLDEEGEQPKSNRVRVSSNDPLMETFDFFVQGRVANAVSCPTTIDMGTGDPAEEVTSDLIVYSETSDSLVIDRLTCEDRELAWYVDTSWSQESLQQDAAKSAVRIIVKHSPMEYGRYSIPVTLSAVLGDEKMTLSTKITGLVRSPISFKSPNISKTLGLDIGTKNSGERIEEFVAVQLRGHEDRRLAVLDFEPKQLQVTMKPLKKAGAYQLVIEVPADCPNVIFNRADQRGYVSVGDPDDPDFSSWFPLYGAIVDAG